MDAEIWETNRRIRSHILSHTRGIPHLAVQFVLVDAVRGGRFTNVAGSAGEHKTAVDTVFFGVEQIGAMKNWLASYTIQEGLKRLLTTRDRIGNESGRTCYRHWRRGTDWRTFFA